MRFHLDLQKNLPIPVLNLPIVVAAGTVHPQWYQSDIPLLDPLPLGAHAFCLGERY